MGVAYCLAMWTTGQRSSVDDWGGVSVLLQYWFSHPLTPATNGSILYNDTISSCQPASTMDAAQHCLLWA